MRAKNTHIIAHVRQHPKLKQNQKEFAEEIGVSGSLIQAIELGQKKLTERMARKISDRYRVSLDQLLTNSIDGGLRRSDGQPWTPEAKEDRQRRAAIRGALNPNEVEKSLVPLQVIIGQVIHLQEFFETDPSGDNSQALAQWISLFYLATEALARLQERDFLRQTSRSPEQLVSDILRMEHVEAGWARQMKRFSELPEPERSRKLMRFCIDRFDKNRSEAYQIIQDEGFAAVAQMGCREFCMTLSRKIKKGAPPPTPKETPMSEIFEAIKAVYRGK